MKNIVANLAGGIVFLATLLVGVLIFESIGIEMQSLIGALYVIFIMLPAFKFTRDFVKKRKS